MQLANAPVSWGVYRAEGAPVTAGEYLEEVAAAGYTGTELGPYGFMPTDPEALRDVLAQWNLALIGAVHVHDFAAPGAGDALLEAVGRVGGLLAAAGAGHLVVMDAGEGYDPDGPPAELSASVARQFDAALAPATDLGLTLSVHPHVGTAVERLREVEALLDASAVALCLDTGHHAFWGDDPAEFLARAGSRLAYVHLKNVDRNLSAAVREGRMPLQAALDRGAFCPLEAGAVDVAGFLRQLNATGFAGPVVVEQDWTSGGETPATLAARNAAFLKGLAA
jgi:inosose dehydratase